MTCARLLSGNRELKYRISEFICSKYGNIPNMATDEIVLRSHTSYCGTIPKLQSPYFNLEGALSHIHLLPGSSFSSLFLFCMLISISTDRYISCAPQHASHTPFQPYPFFLVHYTLGTNPRLPPKIPVSTKHCAVKPQRSSPSAPFLSISVASAVVTSLHQPVIYGYCQMCTCTPSPPHHS